MMDVADAEGGGGLRTPLQEGGSTKYKWALHFEANFGRYADSSRRVEMQYEAVAPE